MECLNTFINNRISINKILQKCKINKPKHLINIKDINKEKITNLPIILNYGKEKKLEYGTYKEEIQLNYHWGQRKLLLTEIQFLTNYYHLFNEQKKYVLYVGAAHGIHIPILSKLFPDINFILYDPGKFRIMENDKIKIYNKFFTNTEAKYYSNNLTNFLFICDIRNISIKKYDLEKSENIISDDMSLQMNWHKIMNPIKSLLKFRPIYLEGNLEYLDGDIYYQPWTGKHSTETRLVPNNKMRIYNNKIYESEMYYFNKIIRKKCYQGILYNPKYYCCCYDCTLEILILFNYLEKFLQQKATYQKAEKLGKYFSKKLTKGKEKSIFDHNIFLV